MESNYNKSQIRKLRKSKKGKINYLSMTFLLGIIQMVSYLQQRLSGIFQYVETGLLINQIIEATLHHKLPEI
jgi:uncharacterized membrane protein